MATKIDKMFHVKQGPNGPVLVKRPARSVSGQIAAAKRARKGAGTVASPARVGLLAKPTKGTLR